MPYLTPARVTSSSLRGRRFELGTLIPLGAGVLKKDLTALALLARVYGTQIYGTKIYGTKIYGIGKCHFENIEEISFECITQITSVYGDKLRRQQRVALAHLK
jgi:hypothetical protein